MRPGMCDMYELRKCRDIPHFGQWAVYHRWSDGCTVQIRYFRKKADALEYMRNKGVAE